MNNTKSGALLAFQKLVVVDTIPAAIVVVMGMDPKKNIREISSGVANQNQVSFAPNPRGKL